jgi:glycosyltransferase involved in cell wall biosynthesis
VSVHRVPRVTFFSRMPRDANFSLEFIFDDVRARLSDEIEATVHVAPFSSYGVLRRLGIILDARLHQGPVNHVTGDIHFVAIGLAKRKTILTVHDCGVVLRSHGWRRAILRIFWYALPLRFASVVTTVSEASKRDILQLANCNPDKIRVVPVAISETFQFLPKRFEKERPRILQVGTAPNKNVPRLVNALRGRACKLVILGPLSRELEGLLRQNGIDFEHIERLSLDDVMHEYQKADIVAFVSTHEGFGMPIIEANAVGRPVICGNTASMPEVAQGAACMVDPYDVQAIRAGIERIISDDLYRDDLVERGRQNVKRYDAEGIAHMYLELYREVAGIKDENTGFSPRDVQGPQ